MRNFQSACFFAVLQLHASANLGAQPAASLTTLEERLLVSESLSLDFELNASGAIEVDIEGSLQRTAAGDIALSANGMFAGQPIDLMLNQRGQDFTYGSRNQLQAAPPPAELWEALVIGFTRMGVLHNIATLSAGMPPDHAQGGVADWVIATNVEVRNSGYNFDIVVADVPSGSATITIDASGNPQLREQTVEFPTGTMVVTERYFNFQVQ